MTNAQALYKDFWVDQSSDHDKRNYYARLYDRLVHKITISPGAKILDVAGGDGGFLRYLKIQSADILDISESGLEAARAAGYRTVFGNIEKHFPVEQNSYDAVFCFEVLEHLYAPNKTLCEIHNALKDTGVLYLGQPNMRADGVHHVRRYYLKDLLSDLEKCGFQADWIDYVPAYSMRDSILSDIRHNKSWLRKIIQVANLSLSFLPYSVRYAMAKLVPNRFALILIIKAVKKEAR